VADLVDSVTRNAGRRDGKGCLEDLDAIAKLDPRTHARMTIQRAQCTMLAGQCDAGKSLARRWFSDTMLEQYGPEQVERMVDSYVGMYCTGPMGDRDALLSALTNLQSAAYMTRKDAGFCRKHHATVERLRDRVKPREDDDTRITHLDATLMGTVPACYQRAGDCPSAWHAFSDLAVRVSPDAFRPMSASQKEAALRSNFEAMVPKCKGRG
jgi:hypothetical protein